MKTRAAIVGVHNTRQGRRLDGETSRGLALKAIEGALSDAGLTLDDVDGISAGDLSTTLIYDLRIGPAWQGLAFGVGMITEAATAIEHGMADVVVLVSAQAGEYRDHEATAPWTRPENEFVAPWGMFTTAEFALIARRHMHVYGTTREQMSIVAATIRNNGSQNPEAIYYQRGPFAPEDITASRPIADPFHLLDCATTSEGGCALVVADLEKFADKVDLPNRPIYVLGSGADFLARRISTHPRGTSRAGAAITLTVWSADGRPTVRSATPGFGVTTWMCWNSTIRSRSKSFGSWRHSDSAAKARVGHSSPTVTLPPTAAIRSPRTGGPCRSATRAPTRK